MEEALVGVKLLEYILVVIVKAILGLILDRVSPEVKKAMEKGMDEVAAGNKVDEAVLDTFKDRSGINAPIDSP